MIATIKDSSKKKKKKKSNIGPLFCIEDDIGKGRSTTSLSPYRSESFCIVWWGVFREKKKLHHEYRNIMSMKRWIEI